jgi:hypothetical protein
VRVSLWIAGLVALLVAGCSADQAAYLSRNLSNIQSPTMRGPFETASAPKPAASETKSAAVPTCPTGSYPWVDKWGNQVCQPFAGGPPVTVQGSLENCPAGTHPSVDHWGTRICKSIPWPGSRSGVYTIRAKAARRVRIGGLTSAGNAVCRPFQ